MKPVVMGFFNLRRGKWVHDRVREELQTYESTSRKRKEAGRKGGLASGGSETGNPQPIASQLPTKPEPEPEEDKPPVSPKGDKPAKAIVLRQSHVEAIWSITPKTGRERSSKADLTTALQGAARRGHDPEAVLAGVLAYYRSDEAVRDDGAFAKGVHRIVQKDRWQSFEAPPSPIEQLAAQPDPLDVWRRRVDRALNGSGAWDTLEWGARPGKPGCKAPAAVLAEFNVPPAEAGDLIPFPSSDRSAA